MPRPLVQTPSLGARGGVIGRTRKQPPPDAAGRIKALAAEGRPKRGIAVMLGTSADTLNRWFAEDEALQQAFDAGREEERAELHGILMRDARDGGKPNINCIFLLKARHGYREGDQAEGGNRLNIVFNLPGAMTREDFLKTVVSESTPREAPNE